ncbi:hypothetical protein BD410DRAFT_615496 [Rickenella mellea]|uniref:Uncharacterized protein n=1 Tax=Rickenella mellea TaxID=50990 RepID=A0A4Y7PN72_9AGAM|nr:hypothetical protein BD410DRAFT_615496 [Rickenella mellea]
MAFIAMAFRLIRRPLVKIVERYLTAAAYPPSTIYLPTPPIRFRPVLWHRQGRSRKDLVSCRSTHEPTDNNLPEIAAVVDLYCRTDPVLAAYSRLEGSTSTLSVGIQTENKGSAVTLRASLCIQVLVVH